MLTQSMSLTLPRKIYRLAVGAIIVLLGIPIYYIAVAGKKERTT